MTDLEKAKESLRIVVEAIEQINAVANNDRKINGLKQIDGHYRKALEQLQIKKISAQDHVKRAEAQAR